MNVSASFFTFVFLGALAASLAGCGGGEVDLAKPVSTPIVLATPSPSPSPIISAIPTQSPSPSPTPSATLTAISIAADANDSIQTNLVSTFPTGTFSAQNPLGTKFSIAASPNTCGYTGTGACNFFDAFSLSNGSGQSITIDASVANAGHVYTLINAYAPTTGAQIATIEFIGSAGATVTFPLIGGEDIRDFYQGGDADTLTNGVPNVSAVNAFTCVDPTNCMGGGYTGNVTTGTQGTYNIDEQAYTLPVSFASQILTQIILTDTQNGSAPILLGITAGP